MKKTLLTIVLTVLICCTVMGTTLALLVDKTNTIENTFTVGDINITLTETANLDLKMVPGKTITKDPKVTVKAGSEACWLFVQIKETNNTYTENGNTKSFMTYAQAEGWTLVPGETDLYYREVGTVGQVLNADAEFFVLNGNSVTVKTDVTKEALQTAKTSAPTLAFTAFAVQRENVGTVAAALEAISSFLTPTT